MPSPELEAAMQMAETLASGGRYEKRAIVCRAVNEALNLEWSDGMWRGIMARYPDWRAKLDTLLGAVRVVRRADDHSEVVLQGDVRGSVSSDEHTPFHDPRAIGLTCDILRWWKPDVHIYNGDQTDWYILSKFDTNPARQFTVQQEADQTKDELFAPVRRAIPKADIWKVDGNHCNRRIKWLWQHPELMGLRALQPENLFDFAKFRINYASLRVRFDDVLEVSHGTKVNKWAKAELEERRYGISTITGHVHRGGRSETRTLNGYVVGHENPCLCTLQPEYKVDPDWIHGITLFEIKRRRLWVETVLFNADYTACAASRWFGTDGL
jgi:hypothetical protein